MSNNAHFSNKAHFDIATILFGRIFPGDFSKNTSKVGSIFFLLHPIH